MRKFIIILCLCFFATPCLAAKEEYIGSRRFQVLVRQDLADEAARVFVETYALEQGMRNLAKNSHLQFAIEPHQALSERELAGFAKILYDLQIVEKGVETYPPEVHTFVHVSMELRENWRRYERYIRYYDGDHNLSFATEKFRNAFGSLFREFAMNMCTAVRDAANEKLIVTEFVTLETE